MKLVVATPEDYSPASRALRMEALGVDEVVCSGPLDYARLFERLWAEGDRFVLCEWDVAPWPGAAAALAGCERPWCVHRYAQGRGMFAHGLGLGAYTPEGPLSLDAPWQVLDGQVLPALRELIGEPHVHEPPVAHVRRGAR